MTFVTFFIGIIIGVVGTLLFLLAAGRLAERWDKEEKNNATSGI